MSGTVCDIRYQSQRMALRIAEQPVYGFYYNLYQIYVLPFVEAAYVVGVGCLPLVEYQVYRTGVVLHIEPVAHILPLAVDREGLAPAYVVYEKRYQLFRELVRAVVVAAVGNNGGHPVCVVKSPYEVVARSLARAVGAVRIIGSALFEKLISERASAALVPRRISLRPCQLQRPVNLIGRDMVEPFALILFGKRLPMAFRRLQQGKGAYHVCHCKCERVLYAAVHMAFGSKVYYPVYLLLLHQGEDCIEIADIRLYEPVIGLVLYIPEIGQIAGIGKLVQIYDSIFRIFPYEQPHHMAAYKAGTAGYEYGFHDYLSFASFNKYCPY